MATTSGARRASGVLVVVAVVAALLILPTSVGASDQFADVPDSGLFHGEISWTADVDIASGFADGEFKPAAVVSRQEMAAFMFRLWVLLGGTPGVYPDPGFFDVSPGQQFYDEISWMAAAGVTGGYPDGGFKPGAVVSRQEMAAFLWRLFDFTSGGVCGAQTEIPVSECTALVALWRATDGPAWTVSTGWELTPLPCSWFGVTCAGGNVTRLDLAGNSLAGTVPSQIDALPNLDVLDLDQNAIEGFSDDLYNLEVLTELGLEAGPLGGGIPAGLASIDSLEVLRLGSNDFSGPIPAEFASMPALRDLDLSANRISGEIPPVLGGLAGLEKLFLDDNLLTGTIPSTFGDLADLDSLRLNDNALAGPVPAGLMDLPALTDLRLNGNGCLTSSTPALTAFLDTLDSNWADGCADNVFVVNRLADGDDIDAGDGVCEVSPGLGDCSLRAAVTQANALGGWGEIQLGAGVTYPLTLCGPDDDTNVAGDLDGAVRLSIQGDASVVVQSCAGERVLHQTTADLLELGAVTITGGNLANTPWDDCTPSLLRNGGGILAAGDVTLGGTTLAGNVNRGGEGGGLWAAGSVDAVSVSVTQNELRNALCGGSGIYAVGDLDVTDSDVSDNFWGCDACSGLGSTLLAGGRLDLIASAVTDNRSDSGAVNGGYVYIQDSTVSGNTLYGFSVGGGVNGGTVEVVRSTISDNQASLGGGIGAGPGGVTVTDSVINDNRAGGGGDVEGGGVYSAGPVTIVRSTLKGNVAGEGAFIIGGSGGGVFAVGDVVVTDSLISMNRTGSDGWGIYAEGDLDITNSTINSNRIDVKGALTTKFTTIGSHVACADAGCDWTAFATLVKGQCVGAWSMVSLGYNAEEKSSTCPFDALTDLGTVPKALIQLGIPADNGGPTFTQLPAATSALVDVVPAVEAACAGTDQRGMTRPFGGLCDVGSVERQGSDP